MVTHTIIRNGLPPPNSEGGGSLWITPPAVEDDNDPAPQPPKPTIHPVPQLPSLVVEATEESPLESVLLVSALVVTIECKCASVVFFLIFSLSSNPLKRLAVISSGLEATGFSHTSTLNNSSSSSLLLLL